LAAANGGGKTTLGLDNSSDIYIGFEYGLTDNLNIDFGRSKFESLLELGLKYNILHQKRITAPCCGYPYWQNRL
jgi:hypothetical protein